MTRARDTANLLADDAIGANELATNLDLSDKTVTLPPGVIGANELAATLDLSGKTVTLPTGTALPDQTGSSGKFLYTDGSSASWETVDTSAAGNDTELQYNNAGARAGAAGLTTDGSNLTINTEGELRFSDSDDSNYIGFKAPATIAADKIWTLPDADGTDGQLLKTDGAGNLSFVSSGASSWTVSGSDVYRSTGKVGIATSSPATTLGIAGYMSMGTTSSYWTAMASASPNVYISPSGNDTTGDGSYGNPWATIDRALKALPRFAPNGLIGGTVTLRNGTYTLTGNANFKGFTGGAVIGINAETAGSVTINLNGRQFDFERNDAYFSFGGIVFNSPSTPSMFNIRDTTYVRFQSNCAINNLTSSSAPGNFNGCISVTNSGFQMECPLTLTYDASYGAVLVLAGSSNCYISGTISKSGSKHGNAAVSVQNSTFVSFNGIINNFNIGINMGQSHYDAELGGMALANGLQLTNCTYGVKMSNGGKFKNYYTTSTSGTTTPVYWQDGWYSGYTGTQYCLVGYNTSVSGSYRLQVNSQIYATSSTIATSDGRFKENVETINNGLELVNRLRPVQFDWKPHEIHNFDLENKTVGFIAQEVLEAFADRSFVGSIVKSNSLVLEGEQYETKVITPATEDVFDQDGNLISPAQDAITEKVILKPAVTEEFLGIAEGNLIAILTKAIQELSEKCEALEARVTELET